MILFPASVTEETASVLTANLEEKINSAGWNNPIMLTCLGIWKGAQKEASLFLSVLENQKHKDIIPASIAFLPDASYAFEVLPFSPSLDRSDIFQMTDEFRFMKAVSDLFYKKFLLTQTIVIEKLQEDSSIGLFQTLSQNVFNGEIPSNGIWIFAEQR